MTKWSVVKDDTSEKRRRRLIPRISLLACLALVVVSLGVALSPGNPKEPAEPTFSEQARSAALAETMRLRAAGELLSQTLSGDGQAAVARTVSLLTSQARALLRPGQDEPASSPSPDSSPSPASSAASTAVVPPVVPPASVAALASELAASASQRLTDAAVADGGMARLLAAVGTAQLLQASSLAAAAGAPAPAVPDPAAPQPSGVCTSATASPASSGAAADDPTGPTAVASAGNLAGTGPAPASLAAALAATVETELETVYGYQVALTRLGGQAAGPAAEQLARHEALAGAAEALSRMHCAPVPPRVAGYQLGQDFLDSPAAGLGGLEAAALPVYGDLVALSEGETRQWAITGLVGAARRAALWGAETGVLPGLTADPEGFPELPSPTPSP